MAKASIVQNAVMKVVKRKYGKKSKKLTVASLQKQLNAIKKNDAPELKFIDGEIVQNVAATSALTVGQGFNTFGPFGVTVQGTANGQRIGLSTKCKYIELRGHIVTQVSNLTGGFVDFYILRYNRYTTGVNFNTVINSQAFLENDGPFNSITTLSFRDREHLKEFTVLGKKRVYMNADNYNTQTITKPVYMKVNLRDLVMTYDLGTTASVVGPGIFLLSVASTGDTTSGSGYSYDVEYRLMYTDV